MRTLLIVLLCMLSASAAAQAVTGTSTSTTNSASTSTAGAQSQNQNIVAPGQTINSTGASRISTAPNVFTPNMQPTVPCMAAYAGGLSVVGFGLSLGAGVEDKECTRREFARVLAQMGFPDAGLAILCANAEVRTTSPQLCSRSDYVSGRPETYVGSEPPVMPPAPVKPSAPRTSAPQQPAVGQIGYDQSGQRMVYNGAAWVAEEQAARVITSPLVSQPPVGGIRP